MVKKYNGFYLLLVQTELLIVVAYHSIIPRASTCSDDLYSGGAQKSFLKKKASSNAFRTGTGWREAKASLL